MESRDIISELDDSQLQTLIKCIDADGDKNLLLKFTATWCKPCQSVAQICQDGFSNIPSNAIIAVIDIDEALDLYMLLKRKRMLTGIPCILSWYPEIDRDYDKWYIPNDSVLSSSKPDHLSFFERAKSKADTIKKT
uniref:Thioredoxin domain-containing protein n=1 Tax=viral metagenome TaxID=1070528 RepID=A0A6C0LI98_9ZZZZ